MLYLKKLLTIKLVALSFYSLFCIFLVVQAKNGFPLPVGDKEWFYPVIHNLHINNELSHPFQTPTNSKWLAYGYQFPHGFLFPRIQNLFNYQNFYDKVHLSSIYILVLNCIILTYLLKNKLSNWLIIPVGLSVFIYQMGRPELVVSTFILLDLIIRKQKKGVGNAYETFITATLFVISPISSILHRLFIGGTFVINYSVKYLTIFPLLTSLFIYGYFFIFGSGDFIEWIKGLVIQSNAYTVGNSATNNIESFNYKAYLPYLWKESTIPLVVLMYIYYYIYILNKIKIDYIQLFFSALFLLFVFIFAIKGALHIYNFIVFIPLIYLNESSTEIKNNNIKNYRSKVIYFISVLILIIFSLKCTFNLYKNTIINGYLLLKYGNNSQKLVQSLKDIENEASVEIPKSFHFAINKNNLIIHQKQDHSDNTSYSGDYVILSQFNVGSISREHLPTIKGYCLIDYNLQFSPMQVLYDWSYLKFKKC